MNRKEREGEEKWNEQTLLDLMKKKKGVIIETLHRETLIGHIGEVDVSNRQVKIEPLSKRNVTRRVPFMSIASVTVAIFEEKYIRPYSVA